MDYRYRPEKGKQVICICGRWGVRCFLEAFLRQDCLKGIDLFKGYDIRIVPGACDEMVEVTFLDPYKKAVQMPRDLFSDRLHQGDGEFSVQDIAYVTIVGGTLEGIEICIPFVYSDFDKNGFINCADAIIEIEDASRLESAHKRERIEVCYANRCLKNVFFLVNHFNLLKEEYKQLFFDELEKYLGSVFVDRNGNFQPELYERRVFLVNLDIAKAARLGETLQIREGKEFRIRKVNRLEDSLSGFQSFENALKTFLRAQKWNQLGKH